MLVTETENGKNAGTETCVAFAGCSTPYVQTGDGRRSGRKENRFETTSVNENVLLFSGVGNWFEGPWRTADGRAVPKRAV